VELCHQVNGPVVHLRVLCLPHCSVSLVLSERTDLLMLAEKVLLRNNDQKPTLFVHDVSVSFHAQRS